jgi:hypothetical protein
LISHFIDGEQVSDGNDIRVMVASLGAQLWQLGKWILLLYGGISITKVSIYATRPFISSLSAPHHLSPFLLRIGRGFKFTMARQNLLDTGMFRDHISSVFFALAASDGSTALCLVVVHRCSGSAILHMALLACKLESPTIHSSTLQDLPCEYWEMTDSL